MKDRDTRLQAAAFVAAYWRDELMKQLPVEPHAVFGVHPLSLVLAAMDGETDPRQLGIPEDQDDNFYEALMRHNPAIPSELAAIYSEDHEDRVAQTVERRAEAAQVAGSTPAPVTNDTQGQEA